MGTRTNLSSTPPRVPPAALRSSAPNVATATDPAPRSWTPQR